MLKHQSQERSEVKIAYAVALIAVIATAGASLSIYMANRIELLQPPDVIEYSGTDPYFFRSTSFSGKFVRIDRRDPVANPEFLHLDIIDIWISEENGNTHVVRGFMSRKLTDIEIRKLINRNESHFPQDVYNLRAFSTFF